MQQALGALLLGGILLAPCLPVQAEADHPPLSLTVNQTPAWSLHTLSSFYIPIMTPLETTLGRYYQLEKTPQSPYAPIPRYYSGYGFRGYDTVGAGSSFQAQSFLPGGETGMGNLFNLGVERFHQFDRSGQRAEEKISAAFTLGYGFQKQSLRNDFNLLFGFSSRYHATQDLSTSELADSDYGTIFFTPGLQLSGKSILFHAILEFPVYKHEMEDLKIKRDRVRANIGVRYLIR